MKYQAYMSMLLPALQSRGFTDIIIIDSGRPSGRVVFNAITAKYRGQPLGLRFDKRGITLFQGAEMRDDQAMVAWAYLKWQAITDPDEKGALIVQGIEHELCTYVLHIPGPERPVFTRAYQTPLMPPATQQPALF